MKHVSVYFLIYILFSGSILGQSGKISRDEYIKTYKDLAIQEMLRSGIPASITLAQGMLESDNGNSTLARKGNNHFGIKCHNGWKGRKIHHHDDARNECFRKYKSAEDSYLDHSDFLMGSSRYAFLFELDRTDYIGWAKGLKKAGYATSPKYADLLIKIVEDNELHQYDLATESGRNKRQRFGKEMGTGNDREIGKNNRINYIILKEGESFSGITDELHLLRNAIYRYNDLPENAKEVPGQLYYIQPKRNKAERGKDYHILQSGESLWSVSQKYGIKLDKLSNMNFIEEGTKLEPGMKINLRRKKRSSEFVGKERLEEEINEDKIQFEFDDEIN